MSNAIRGGSLIGGKLIKRQYTVNVSQSGHNTGATNANINISSHHGYQNLSVSENIPRTLFFFFVGKRVILTSGFIKKTEKTPQAEIDKAKRYRSEFLSRKENPK